MGGLGTIFAAVLVILLLVLLQGLNIVNLGIDNQILGALAFSILIVALIGAVDDIVSIRQSVKAVLPMLAGLPIVLVLQGTAISLPLVGSIDFGIAYLAIAFLSIAVSSNLTNMLAGFNGLEYGMALPMYAGSLALGLWLNIPTVALISSIMLGVLLAGFCFGFPKARAFPGDIGTLSIGGTMAIMLLLGHIERYAIVFIPYMVDFAIKALNGFPSKDWWGEYKYGKLYCPQGKYRGFAQLVMKLANGVKETNLVLFFIGLETLFALLALALFFL
jgi:UDP-N-acetylglucosamine--dolichyl-phosphate N-acetylglucosaminephosphotransferase